MANDAGEKLRAMGMNEALERRYALEFDEYDGLIGASRGTAFGSETYVMDPSTFKPMYQQFFEGQKLCILSEIKDFHRAYSWS